jgi:hypothetical protein
MRTGLVCTVLCTNHVHTSLCHELESGRKYQALACMEVFLPENLWSADVIPGSVKILSIFQQKFGSVYSGKLLPET